MIHHSFDKIIQDLEREDMGQRDRGTLFELLVIAYLKHEPMYARLYEEVWMLGSVPEEYGIPKKDTGVDLVARNRETGEFDCYPMQVLLKRYNNSEVSIESTAL